MDCFRILLRMQERMEEDHNKRKAEREQVSLKKYALNPKPLLHKP